MISWIDEWGLLVVTHSQWQQQHTKDIHTAAVRVRTLLRDLSTIAKQSSSDLVTVTLGK